MSYRASVHTIKLKKIILRLVSMEKSENVQQKLKVLHVDAICSKPSWLCFDISH